MIDVLIAARAIHFAATATVTGVAMFRSVVAEPAFGSTIIGNAVIVNAYRSKLRYILWTSFAFTVLSGAVWLFALAAEISRQPLLSGAAFKNSLILLTETQFGSAWIARFGLCVFLLGALILETWEDAKRRRWKGLAAFLTICLMGSLAWSGHAGGTPGLIGDVHVAADFLHLVAAGAWLGGLLPLALLLTYIREKTDFALALAARNATVRFSTLGLLSVSTLLATGVVNTWMLVDSLPGLIGTTYGRLLLAKIALFLAMISLAAVNNFRLTPALPDDEAARLLGRNAFFEIGLGLVVLIIVSILGILPPAAHMNMRMH